MKTRCSEASASIRQAGRRFNRRTSTGCGGSATPLRVRAKGFPKRVFLVDPFPSSRLALAEWLSETTDLILCGEADSPARGLNAVRVLRPDVVVTEVMCQQDFGFIRSLHRLRPRPRILVFSFRDEEGYAPRALEAGADGYLTKGATIAAFVEGIRAAAEGRVVLSRRTRARLLAKCVKHHHWTRHPLRHIARN